MKQSERPRLPVTARVGIYVGAGAVVLLVLVAAAIGMRGVAFFEASAQPSTRDPPLTARVTRETLRRVVMGSASVAPSNVVEVPPPSLPSGTHPVITHIPRTPDGVIDEGDVLLAVADRPVIALQGDIPAYRDMRPDLSGPDVLQLQEALERLGYDVGSDPRGTYGRATAEAVRGLHADRGFGAVDIAGSDVTDRSSGLAAVRFGEVIFVSSFPVRVVDRRLEVGHLVSEAVLSLAVGPNRLLGSIPTVSSPDVPIGAEAEVRFEGKPPIAAVVRGLGGDDRMPASPSDNDTPVEFSVDQPLDSDLLGRTGQLTVVTAQSDPDAWVVPITAIHASADGQTWVRIVEAESLRDVTVTVQLVADGKAALIPEDGQLSEGDEVLIAEVPPPTEGGPS